MTGYQKNTSDSLSKLGGYVLFGCLAIASTGVGVMFPMLAYSTHKDNLRSQELMRGRNNAEIIRKYDKNEDGTLNRSELEALSEDNAILSK